MAAKHGYSVEDLAERGAGILMRILLGKVASGSTVTYGQVARVLERELSIPKIFPIHIGHVAGRLMNLLLELDGEMPLINVLVVDQADGVAGPGITGYLEHRYGKSWRKYPTKPIAKRQQICAEAAIEVFAYSAWPERYEELFGKAAPEIPDLPDLEESDGKSPDGRRGGDAESLNTSSSRTMCATIRG